MAAPSPIHSSPLSLLLVLLVLATTTSTGAQVPAASTFKYVNEGEFGMYLTEYRASYRATPLYGSPFQLMWYNSTPDQYYLGLRMGLESSESLFRWVWDANRGRPVGENATLTFGRDGNLVLAEADGTAVWSTKTANKGVVGIKILPVGNIVLYDKKGKFLWQSFDHPTDTLFVGQSLKVRGGGPNKLVSRRSYVDNSDGIYSLVLEPRGLNLYVASSPKPLVYSSDRFSTSSGTVSDVTFKAEPDMGTSTELQLSTTGNGIHTLARPKYNATQSILRLEADGNLVAYTYYGAVNWGAWETTYSFFSDVGGTLGGCELPSTCGSLGLCQDGMCVACPTAPKGSAEGWSRSCAPPKLAPCKEGKPVDFFKVSGVEAFLPKFNLETGLVAVEECKRRCRMGCSCLGFFYWEESSKCWLAPSLGTLTKVTNSSHVAYIKYSL